MAKLKILICGGGPAGNALAFWLAKQQHDVTVLERFSTLRVTGLQIDLRGHGVKVPKRMGLEKDFLSHAVPEQGLEIVHSAGKRKARKETYNSTAYVAPDKRILLTRRHRGDRIQVYLISQVPSERMQRAAKNDVAEEKAAFAEMFRGAGWKADEILHWLAESDDFYCERLSTVKLSSWSEGRVTRLGDAAYCPSTATGIGTTSAIVGAYILAGEIGRHCAGSGTKETLPSALQGYDRVFRPFMEQVQEGIAPETGYWTKLLTSPVGIAVLNFLLGLAAFFRLDAFAKLLDKDVKGWDLPEYEGMNCRASSRH
ncbi:unnamed protein product [Zymoseptoria tritici ST99CH_3D1]|nr:unnamed protein product [Zymoseptoria tritici ST99CH_3D1]